MPFLPWSDSFTTGVPDVDRQHQALIAVINDLHDAVRAGTDRSAHIDILERLALYAQEHFELEEGLMESAGFPGLTDHKAQHHTARSTIHHFRNDYLEGRVVLNLDLLNFLKSWLTDHILGSDLQYVGFFKARGIVH